MDDPKRMRRRFLLAGIGAISGLFSAVGAQIVLTQGESFLSASQILNAAGFDNLKHECRYIEYSYLSPVVVEQEPVGGSVANFWNLITLVYEGDPWETGWPPECGSSID